MKTKCKSKNLIENKYWKKGVYGILITVQYINKLWIENNLKVL